MAFFVCYAFTERLFDFITRPLLALEVGHGAETELVHLIGTGVGEAFLTKLKVSFIAAIFGG